MMAVHNDGSAYDHVVCEVVSLFMPNLKDRAMEPFEIRVREHAVRRAGKTYITRGGRRFNPAKFGKVVSQLVSEAAQKETVCLQADVEAAIAAVTEACRKQAFDNVAKQLRLQAAYEAEPIVTRTQEKS